MCASGGIGRRTGLKILCLLWRAGSSPALRTVSGYSAVWKRACIGSRMSGVRIPLPGPFGVIAQLEEHLLCKQRVSGSSPLGSIRKEDIMKIEPTYSIGDVVRILPAEVLLNKPLLHFGFNDDMVQYCGLTVTINNISSADCLSTRNMEPRYYFEDAPDGINEWFWGEDMFELIRSHDNENEEIMIQAWLDIMK